MKIFKKSKEQVEENKSEDLKIENQENKRETTSEKKGVVSLQFSEEMSEKRIHSIITVAGVSIALFLITLMMHTIVSKVVYPNFSMANEINEVQFLWGTSDNDLKREDAVWKQATDENKIQKIGKGQDYVCIKVDIPAQSNQQYYTYYTNYAPSKVLVDGKKIYDNGYDKENVVGNRCNKVELATSAVSRTMEIYIYSPIGFQFRLVKSTNGTELLSNASGLGIAFTFGILMLAIIFVIMTIAISIKDKNIIKVLLLSLTLFMGALYLMLYQLSLGSTLISESVFFSLQLILTIYFATSVLVCSLCSINYKFKLWQNIFIIGVFVISLGLLLIENRTVLLIAAVIFSMAICVLIGLFIIEVANLIENKTPYMSLVGIAFVYISLVNIYNLISLTAGSNGLSRTVVVTGIAIYEIAMYIVLFKQSVNHTILIKERANQQLESAVSIQRMATILSDVADALTDKQFASYTCQIFTDVIKRNELAASNVVTDDETNEKIVIPSCAAVRREDGTFEEVFNQGGIEGCDYEKIMSMYDGTEKSKVKFAQTYMDLIFVRIDQVQIIFHIENYKDGLSETFQSTAMMIHHIMEIAFSNYNLKSRIKTVQEDAIISLAEMVEFRGKQNKVHLYSVSAVTKVICKALGLSEEETRIISMAAIAHDIGKIAIPNDILNGDKPLTDKEYEIMKKHVVYGYNILSKNSGDFMEAAAVIAYQHHENYDGTGYLGLSGENIHLYARIVKVADVFDALMEKRTYKKAWPPQKVREYILEKSGIEFDPAIVKVFDKVFDEAVEASKTAREKYK